MELPTITIACVGATTFELDELNDLQGELKELSEENYVKLRNSIIEFGFSFPIDAWLDEESKAWVLDGHQRIKTLRKMREEGIIVPPLPANYISAATKTEAKKKLLLLNSRYGTMTREGFDAFIDEEDSPIDESLEAFLVLPEVEFFDDKEEAVADTSKEEEDKGVICPKCGHHFTPEK